MHNPLPVAPCADEPLLRVTRLSASFQDYSTKTTKYVLLLQRLGTVPTETEIAQLVASLTIRTWPESVPVATSVSVEDIKDPSDSVFKRVVVEPVTELQPRWYSLHTTTLPEPFRWSEEVLVKAESDGSYLLRFRPDSAPTVRRMVVYDKLEPLSEPVDMKFETAVDVEFSEAIPLPAPDSARTVLSVSARDLRSCDVYAAGSAADPTTIIRARCKGRLRGNLMLAIDATQLPLASSKSALLQRSLEVRYNSLAVCGSDCRFQALE
jgi:hypothetical protein